MWSRLSVSVLYWPSGVELSLRRAELDGFRRLLGLGWRSGDFTMADMRICWRADAGVDGATCSCALKWAAERQREEPQQQQTTFTEQPVRPSFIFRTQSKIFLMKSESSLTLHREQGYYHDQMTKCKWLILSMSLLRFCALIVVVPLPSMGGSESSQISSTISYFVFWRWTKVLWVWNDMRVSN